MQFSKKRGSKTKITPKKRENFEFSLEKFSPSFVLILIYSFCKSDSIQEIIFFSCNSNFEIFKRFSGENFDSGFIFFEI